MILTLTANPSVDLTLQVNTFETGEVNRAVSKAKDPAGKGINVSRALHKNAVPTTAIFPADAVSGKWIESALSQLGIATQTTPITEEVRQNITIVDDQGITTKINEAGPCLTSEEKQGLLNHIETALSSSPKWLVTSGSIPPGLDDTFYITVGEIAHKHGVKFAVDTSGTALKAIVDAKIADVLKPNIEELEELAGTSLPTVGEVVTFAQSILSHPEAYVLVSLGENGALLVTARGAIWAGHDTVIAESTVGAGDSTLAGFLSADIDVSDHTPQSQEVRIARAVAWGAAAVQLPGTTVPGPKDINLKAVHTVIDPRLETPIKELHV